MSDVAIRDATAGDADAIASMIAELGYGVTAEDISARLKQIESTGEAVLVADLDGRAIGCLSTSTMIVLHRPAPVGRISMMVVDERYRGRGIGAVMVKAAERLLTSKGCRLVEVTSNNRRIDAHRFWEANGYERTSTRFAKDTAQ
jgi:GNAT superfamily N-acetyltransferase